MLEQRELLGLIVAYELLPHDWWLYININIIMWTTVSWIM